MGNEGRPPSEIEIKLPVRKVGATLRKLRGIGARVPKGSRGRVFEHNVLFDLPSHPLRRRGALLRLRWQMPAARAKSPVAFRPSAGSGLLTYKGRASRRGGYKVAEEVEAAVEDPQIFAAILMAAGFEPSFRYEKFRRELEIPGLPGLTVDLDETPVGDFVELEGPREVIDRAAARLGYRRGDYITGSYADLQRDFCRRRGRKFGDMLFPRPKS